METSQFWERLGTFSMLAFKGDVRLPLRELLCDLDYIIQATRQESGSAMAINQKITFTEDSTIEKAYWFSGGFTIMLDPEMVMCHADVLDAFCKEHSISMVSATWESMSQSAIVIEISSTGERRTSYVIEGNIPDGAPPPAHPVLIEKPGPLGIRDIFLATSLALEQALRSNVEATILSVTE